MDEGELSFIRRSTWNVKSLPCPDDRPCTMPVFERRSFPAQPGITDGFD
jgi:hypothetical protein